MNCHAVTRVDKPEIKRVTAAFKANEVIEWQRVYTLPDHVYFDHRPHVNAGIACQTCHGEVQTMERVSREMLMRMGNCLSCHRDAHEAVPPGSKITQGTNQLLRVPPMKSEPPRLDTLLAAPPLAGRTFGRSRRSCGVDLAPP